MLLRIAAVIFTCCFVAVILWIYGKLTTCARYRRRMKRLREQGRFYKKPAQIDELVGYEAGYRLHDDIETNYN